jgi:hypothetical protein
MNLKSDIQEDQPIFITGSVRSGTSVVTKALVKGAKIKGYTEGCFVQHLGSFVRSVDRDFDRRGSQLLHPNIMAAHVDRNEMVRSFCDWFKDEYRKWTVYHADQWVDKTADIGVGYAMPEILETWPRAKCIFLKRRPVENIVSRQKKFPNRAFEKHVQQWVTSMQYWLASKRKISPERYIEIDQYDIAMNPENVALRLQKFLNLNDKQGKAVAKILTKSRPEFTGGDESAVKSLEELEWTPAEKEFFKKHCGSIVEDFGWTLGNKYYKN